MQHQDSLKRHISHLEDSHVELERRLLLLEEHLLNDTTIVCLIKKKKLYIKDELIRCRKTLANML